MGTLRNLNLLKPNMEAITRVRYPIAASQTIPEGAWFTLNAAGAATLVAADSSLALQNFEDSNSPSVSSVQGDNFTPGTTDATIGTGGVVGLEGMYRCSVTTAGYDATKTFTQGQELTVKTAGKLEPASSGEFVHALVEKVIGADSLLNLRVISTYLKP